MPHVTNQHWDDQLAYPTVFLRMLVPGMGPGRRPFVTSAMMT
jgi:hypothetical protein